MTVLVREEIDGAPAWRMAMLAFVSQATTIAAIYGAFGVMLDAVEQRTGANRELTSLALPFLSVTAAVLSPAVGYLATRWSLRMLLIAGAMAGIAGFSWLAISPSVIVFLAAYTLLVGPSACLCSSVLPTVLVSRWFLRERGRALGVIHMPLMAMIVPVPIAYLLGDAGLSAVYWALAGLMGVVLLASLFVLDQPASGAAPADQGGFGCRNTPAAANDDSEWTLRRIAAQPWYWGLVFALATVTTTGTIMTIHIVAAARQWGIGMAPAASLLSLSAMAGLAGSFVLGWSAEKLGGSLTLTIACVDAGLLWALMLVHPSYSLLAPIVALLGLHIAGAIPALALALSRQFGPTDFGGAFGLAITFTMVLPLLIVPTASALYVHSGSYTGMILLNVGLLTAGAVAAFSARFR